MYAFAITKGLVGKIKFHREYKCKQIGKFLMHFEFRGKNILILGMLNIIIFSCFTVASLLNANSKFFIKISVKF